VNLMRAFCLEASPVVIISIAPHVVEVVYVPCQSFRTSALLQTAVANNIIANAKTRFIAPINLGLLFMPNR
jgi:hypothetical protein